MVEASPPVNRRTLKELKSVAKDVVHRERKIARKRSRNHGYGIWDFLKPDSTTPPELHRGHEWRLVSTGHDGNTGVSVSYGAKKLKIDVTPPKSEIPESDIPKSDPYTIDIPIGAYRRRGGEATEGTEPTTQPLTEQKAQNAKKLLQKLATSKR
ncbi:MAG TPA: hypothetical protein VM077_02970 [Candidatus Limnocylindrales bacterium]|nr:hypothetical protein [Candidatus Limnocylindrales bacterium]